MHVRYTETLADLQVQFYNMMHFIEKTILKCSENSPVYLAAQVIS